MSLLFSVNLRFIQPIPDLRQNLFHPSRNHTNISYSERLKLKTWQLMNRLPGGVYTTTPQFLGYVLTTRFSFSSMMKTYTDAKSRSLLPYPKAHKPHVDHSVAFLLTLLSFLCIITVLTPRNRLLHLYLLQIRIPNSETLPLILPVRLQDQLVNHNHKLLLSHQTLQRLRMETVPLLRLILNDRPMQPVAATPFTPLLPPWRPSNVLWVTSVYHTTPTLPVVDVVDTRQPM